MIAMLSKGSKVKSMITGSCPKCQNESMYVNQNPYSLSDTMKMHEKCRHCGLKYKMEPNFFFGAMYVSYGLSVLEGVAVFTISKLGFKMDLGACFIAISIVLILSMPIITRLSRNIYINMFVNYDRNAASEYARIHNHA